MAGAMSGGWATCPVTEAGFIRVSANSRVLDHAVTVADAVALLRDLRSLQGHAFLEDRVSLGSTELVDVERIQGYRQVTDAHILAVARTHEARVVTFDNGLAALGGDDVVHLRL